jgi:alkanesulfonate monooxygenase SsuD/methylene tetrahydromethanopterin reductase-like flavin-dependent oxidoreductase (luciferase family)
MGLEFWVFLPQMRMSFETLVQRAVAAEAAGFSGFAGMDHLTPPGASDAPMFETMVTNTWLAAKTEALAVGTLVQCDSFRHPAVLAREAVTIDHASGGRFELGIGWGSVADELDAFGIGSIRPADRLGRLRESLEIIEALWSGESFDYQGQYFQLQQVQQRPVPLTKIPIVIGGAGKGTMALVAEHADWWNLHIGIVDRLDEMRSFAGSARCSLQQQIAFVASESDRNAIIETAHRRFGDTAFVGNAAQCLDYFGGLQDRGIERAYVWFCDFAAPETLLAFGEAVIEQFK